MPPEDAYGEREPGLEQQVERSALPEGVSEGDAVRAQVDGNEIVLWVRDISPDAAVVDANHPLAGRTLVFDVELLKIQPAA